MVTKVTRCAITCSQVTCFNRQLVARLDLFRRSRLTSNYRNCNTKVVLLLFLKKEGLVPEAGCFKPLSPNGNVFERVISRGIVSVWSMCDYHFLPLRCSSTLETRSPTVTGWTGSSRGADTGTMANWRKMTKRRAINDSRLGVGG